MDKKNVDVFKKHKVLTKTELQARMEILLNSYTMSLNIEAKTMLNIAKRQILPASVEFSSWLANAVKSISSAGVKSETQKKMLENACGLINRLSDNITELEQVVDKASKVKVVSKQAEKYRDIVIPAMDCLRKTADELETVVDAQIWPLPTYAEMLFLR